MHFFSRTTARRALVLVMLGWAAGVHAVGAPGEPSGYDLRGFSSQTPRVARDGAGNIVMVGAYFGDDFNTSGYGIEMARYDAGGGFLGDGRVNTTTAFTQENPDIAMAPDGRFVVVWESGITSSIYGQRYAANGTKVGGEFLIASQQSGYDQEDPAVVMAADGSFAVSWFDNGFIGVWVQRYDANGVAQGSKIRIDDTSVHRREALPDIALTPGGGFAAIYQTNTARGLVLRRFGADNVAIGEEVTVTTSSSIYSEMDRPSIGADAGGGLVIAWPSGGIYMRRYDAEGVALADAALVYAAENESMASPELAVSPDGSFVVAWWARVAGTGPQITTRGVLLRRYGSDGAALADTQLVSAAAHASSPDVAADADGDIVVVWSAFNGNSMTTLGRRYAGPEPVDLALTASVAASTTCDAQAYTIDVANQHAAAAPNVGLADSVTVSLRLPDTAEFVSAQGAGWSCIDGSIPLQCSHSGPLAPGVSTHLVVNTLAPRDAGGREVTPTVSAVQYDPAAANDTVVLNAEVAQGAPAGTLSASPAPFSVVEGGTAAITLTRTGGSNCSAELFMSYAGTAEPGSDFGISGLTYRWEDGDAVSRTVEITATDDKVDEEDEGLVWELSATGASLAQPSLTGTLVDNDTAGLVFLVPGGQLRITEGETGYYLVRLASEPSATVTVTIGTDSGRLSLEPTQLTFASGPYWDVSQYVHVTAVDDSEAQGNGVVTVTHSLSSSDPKYNGAIAAPVAVGDNDGGGGGAIGLWSSLWLWLALLARSASATARPRKK